MIELIPCPFCESPFVDYNSLQISDKGIMVYAKCPDCKTNFRVFTHIYNQRPIEDRLRKALKFYADIENWKMNTENIGIENDMQILGSSKVERDGGKVARSALKYK